MATPSNSNAFATFLWQRKVAEDFEFRQQHLEWEEERAWHEEETHEISQKKSRQQEQTNILF
jgi:hypothetical protein